MEPIEFAIFIDPSCYTSVAPDPRATSRENYLAVADWTYGDLIAGAHAGGPHGFNGERHLILGGHSGHHLYSSTT
jgi:hypothetical protein